MANTPLSSESILQHMAEALPTHAKDDTNSDISSSYEAIALFSHACMVAVGFRLIAFAEGQKTEAEFAQLAPRLSSKWNSSFGSHSFLYAHSQSSMQYLLKVDRLGGKAEIRGIGLAEGAEKITRLEITAKDYISSSALPLRIPITESGEEDRTTLPRKLNELFISPARINDLTSLFKINIIQNLIPGLQKEGYEETPSAPSQGQTQQTRANPPQNSLHDPAPPEPARPYPFHDPLAAAPRHPTPQGDFPPPDFDDEYDLNRPLRGMPQAPGYPDERSPFNIGGDDLNPPGLGPHDPLRGSFVPGGGWGARGSYVPGGGFGGRGGSFVPGGGFAGQGGGMHPTFDDPLFGGGRGGHGDPSDPRVPPGARWDDIGPGGGPRGGGGGGAGGGPQNPFGGFGGNGFI